MRNTSLGKETSPVRGTAAPKNIFIAQNTPVSEGLVAEIAQKPHRNPIKSKIQPQNPKLLVNTKT